MYFITVSRQIGAKGTEIARQVANELQYQFYDTEAIEQLAGEMGFLQDVREIDNKTPPFFKRFFSNRPEVLLERLHMVLYELAKRGSGVFLGRGGNLLFRSMPCTLHVRVIVSRDKRVQTLVGKDFTRDGAMDAIEKSDHERRAFIQFAFGQNWDNPELYDIVLNTDNVAVTIAASAISTIARIEQDRATPSDVLASFEMLGLALRVEAALTEGGFPRGYISVSVHESGKIRLTGVVQVPWEKTNAENLAAKVEGARSLENQIQIAAVR